MAIKYTNTEQVAQQMANFYASQARLELEAKHTRTAIRAKWKKVGSDWQPVNVTKQKVKANYVASGNLVRSIKPFVDGMEFGITMDWYGEAIRTGRQPWPSGKFRGGMGIPTRAMEQWIMNKRLRPRNPESGQFLKNTRANKKAMGFMMNRKIKHFGIEPFDFLKKATVSTNFKFKKALEDAVKKDIQNYVANI